MELTLDRPGNHLFIRSVSEDGICVVDDTYRGPIIVSASRIIEDWEAGKPGHLTEDQLAPILELEPEIVLLGTGARQVFLPPEQLMNFYRREIGIEVMTTDAACRTFNVLVSEARKVVAALLPPATTP